MEEKGIYEKLNENVLNYMNSKENNINHETSKKSNNEFNPSFRHKFCL